MNKIKSRLLLALMISGICLVNEGHTQSTNRKIEFDKESIKFPKGKNEVIIKNSNPLAHFNIKSFIKNNNNKIRIKLENEILNPTEYKLSYNPPDYLPVRADKKNIIDAPFFKSQDLTISFLCGNGNLALKDSKNQKVVLFKNLLNDMLDIEEKHYYIGTEDKTQRKLAFDQSRKDLNSFDFSCTKKEREFYFYSGISDNLLITIDRKKDTFKIQALKFNFAMLYGIAGSESFFDKIEEIKTSEY